MLVSIHEPKRNHKTSHTKSVIHYLQKCDSNLCRVCSVLYISEEYLTVCTVYGVRTNLPLLVHV